MKKNDTPLLEDGDGKIVVGLVNWMAKSLDPSELSKEEALLLFMVLSRVVAALWDSFERELLILFRRHRDRILNTILQGEDESDAVDDEDELDDDDGSDGSNGSDGSSSGGQPPLQ